MNEKDVIKNKIREQLAWYIKSGKKTTPLKREIAETFNLSREEANILVNTEMARMQIQDSLDRYKKSGLEYFEFYAGIDDKTCNECSAIDGKKFKLKDAKIGVNVPPLHDGCRCCILPVVD